MPEGPTTDRWGIDDRYLDVKGRAHRTSEETRGALLRAMGALEDGDPDQNAGPYGDVVVVRGGGGWTPPGRGDLRLEDGTARAVDAKAVELPLGYHDFHAEGAAKPIRVIACPRQCYLPEQARLWGWAVQLYAARARRSWGIGDLADLRRIADWSHAMGAGVMMLNPLSAATPVPPLESSPYYPSSRRFRNPLYIAVEEAPGASELGDQLAPMAERGRGLNAQRRIDRDLVFALKMSALEACFQRVAESPAALEPFARYRAEQGAGLAQFATYCALAEAHGRDWRTWPHGLGRPDAPGVVAEAQARRARVDFHAWLQWLLDEQLRRASDGGVALVQDLPIGIDVAGADAWCWQDQLGKGVSVGVPPDMYNPSGQDWGLVPFVPHRLRASGYQPIVETLRATARHAGGIRIDHVMGLFRLFWIPPALGPSAGAFVRTRADELLGIIALESERARAFVVGEDLGTVEPGVREAMADRRLLSYRLMYFEGTEPEEYPDLALSTVTTHDLPTIAGLWTGADLERARAARAPQNEEALLALREKLVATAGVSQDARVEEAIAKVYVRLAAASSRVLLASLDDGLALEERPNIPGAPSDWPNWSLALPVPVDDWDTLPLPRAIAEALCRRR